MQRAIAFMWSQQNHIGPRMSVPRHGRHALAHDAADRALCSCGKEMEPAAFEPARPALMGGTCDERERQAARVARASTPTIGGTSDARHATQIRPLSNQGGGYGEAVWWVS